MPEETFTTGSVQLEEEETQVGHPPLFAVVFFNDDYTPNGVCCICNSEIFWF